MFENMHAILSYILSCFSNNIQLLQGMTWVQRKEGDSAKLLPSLKIYDYIKNFSWAPKKFFDHPNLIITDTPFEHGFKIVF